MSQLYKVKRPGGTYVTDAADPEGKRPALLDKFHAEFEARLIAGSTIEEVKAKSEPESNSGV